RNQHTAEFPYPMYIAKQHADTSRADDCRSPTWLFAPLENKVAQLPGIKTGRIANSLEQVPNRATVVLQRPATGPSLLVHPLMKFGKQNRLLGHLPRHWGCNGTGAPEVSQEHRSEERRVGKESRTQMSRKK